MKIFKHIIGFLLIMPLLTFGSTDTTPDGFLRDSVKEVSLFINENKKQLDKDDTFLRDKMNQIVIPKLNILLMSKIVLGKHLVTFLDFLRISLDVLLESL